MNTPAPLALLLPAIALSACVGVPQDTRTTSEIQILAINDFHGNLEVPARPERYVENGVEREANLGGAARLGGTLAALRQQNSVTVAAGDLIGASPLTSALFLDEPSIAALTAMGLDIASVGNHEFDRGIEELRRIQNGGCEQFTTLEPCAIEPFAGAGFTYLAGNVVDDAGTTLFPATTMRDIGGVTIGFIGLTLQDTPTLVADNATAGYRFLAEAETANALAQQLVADGADTVVLIIHEGAYGPQRNTLGTCPELSGPLVPIVAALDDSISVVASGHTHNAYVCQTQNDSGGPRLLSSAGRHGSFVTDIALTWDHGTDSIASISGRNVPVDGRSPELAETAAIVARYAEAAGPIADRVVGQLLPSEGDAGDCSDTPAQGLVADSYLYAARSAGEADMALVNSGGVRTDLSGAADGALTYGELAAMSPFGNTILTVPMTGAELLTVLAQQVCEEGGVATRCGAMLVPSANVSYRIDLAPTDGNYIRSLLIDGRPIDPEATYTVATNNFLKGGGDGFSALVDLPVAANLGIDLDWLERYIAATPRTAPICGRVRVSS